MITNKNKTDSVSPFVLELIGIALCLPEVRLQGRLGFGRDASSYRQASIPSNSHFQQKKRTLSDSLCFVGADRDRTDYLLNAIQSL